ncbi:AsmA-like C-terminal region-containing protein, partial [Muriicola sp.]|uniref:AsmA-like C-terminal region-containing protein n=1 Tax=Muriicola sp. TaxID=2020856 RepID=UPI003C717676
LRGQMTGGGISGNLFVKDFNRPYIKSDLRVSLRLDGYDDIFELPNIDSLHGSIKLVANFDGFLNLVQEQQTDSIGGWSLDMEDIGFRYLPSRKPISKLNGVLSETRNEVSLDHISLLYDNSNIAVDGRIKNLYHFIFNKEHDIEADLNVKSTQLYTSHFIFNPESESRINDRISNLELAVKVTGRDNDSYDSFLPTFTAELENLSFELDKLPGIPKLEGLLEFEETKAGYKIDIRKLHADLPVGSVDILGGVFISNAFKTLDVNADLDFKDVPVEYVKDLINEMKHRDLLNAKRMNRNKLTLFNGDVNVSGVIETLPFALGNTTITKSNISLRQPDAVVYKVANLNLELDSLHFLRFPGSKTISGIKSVGGALQADAINSPTIKEIPVDMIFTGINDELEIEFSTLRGSETRNKGSLSLDLAEKPPFFDLKYELNDVPIAPVLAKYSSENLMTGNVSALCHFTGSGLNVEEAMTSLKGQVNIQADSLVLYGIDLDDLLRKYKRSQKFNLADVSAFVLVGPFGAAITKGANFTSLIAADMKSEDRTYVTKAIANWSIDKGILKTEDVAFSTQANRLAFQGKIDYVHDTIPGFNIYMVDYKGCSLMQQRIWGNTDNIEIGKLKIAKTILGSVINLVNAIVGKNCEQVYNGAVAHPIKPQ